MYLLLLSCFLVAIPNVDYTLTKKLIDVRKSKIKTQLFSHYIVYINFFFNCYLYWQNISVHLILWRYFIELFIINILFKYFIFRTRPIFSFIGRRNFQSFHKMKIHNFDIRKKKRNQSFPSGHVSTVYLTWCLIPNTWLILYSIYSLIVALTIYARVNVRAHHLSDCLFAILISHYFFYLNYMWY
jgi:membrane-associated phospholipid phosphatase